MQEIDMYIPTSPEVKNFQKFIENKFKGDKMSETMYCPMTFGNPDDKRVWRKCNPNCAWAIKGLDNYCCAISALVSSKGIINTQPLKEKND